KEIEVLVNQPLKPGSYEYSFDASSVASRIYFYKMISDNFSQARKMLVIK
ncbi:T9SS C-terminal target domain-containing protein, partial [bacterium]